MLASAQTQNSTESLSALLDELKVLKVRLSKVEQERDEYRKLVLHLREENERLRRGLLGRKAERLPANDAQLSMAVLEMMLGSPSASPSPPEPAPEPTKPAAPQPERKKPVRKPLPTELPRIHLEILPPEVQREGLDSFEFIGSDFREVLERRSASTVVVRIEYKKFVRKAEPSDNEPRILCPEPIDLPIVRGTAGPGLLADSIVRRWQDHQPLHRLEGIYGRDGLSLSRSTLCTWHEQLADLVRPLVASMLQDARSAPYLCVDATGVLVRDKERCRNGHFWVLVAPGRHVLFHYSSRHTKEAIDELLGSYQGYLVADAHSVYEHLYTGGQIVEVACWAHCRRYFFKALGSEPDRAKVALAFFSSLFLIERELASLSAQQRLLLRQERSKPLVDQFFLWVNEQLPSTLEESPLYGGLRYALNQREALQRFLTDGSLPLDNNISELNLRRQVLGRHNWLFCGSDDGARVNTVFVSLLASCQMHKLEPLAYLRDLLFLLPRWPSSRLLLLSPAHFKLTLQEPHTQQLLAELPLRRALLSSSS